MATNGVAVDDRLLKMQQHGGLAQQQQQQQRRMSTLSHLGGVNDHRGSSMFGVGDSGLDHHHHAIPGLDISNSAPAAPPVDEDLIEFLDAWNQGPLES
jgi:hypothetical protein